MEADRIHPRYRAPLVSFGLSALEKEGGVCYATDSRFRLVYVNPAWFRYAAENGAPDFGRRWGLGACVLDAVPSVLRPFFFDLYARASRQRRDPHPVQFLYDCSSHDRYRLYAMNLFALEESAHLAVHSLRVERPHDRPDWPPEPSRYAGRGDLMRQCVHCHRFRRAQTPQWDWVSAWIASPPENVSHGLCPICRRHYYGERGFVGS